VSDCMFHVEEEGREMSVLEYFKIKFPRHPVNPNLPCVKCGRASEPESLLLPIDLCKIAPGQTQRQMSGEVQAAMIAETAIDPARRFKELQSMRQSIERGPDDKGDATANAFGVHLRSLQKARARILPPCKLLYLDRPNGNTTPIRINEKNASWNLRQGSGGDVAFIKPATVSGSWMVAFFDRINEQSCQGFISTYSRLARQRGMNLGQPPPLGEWVDGTRAVQRQRVDAMLEEEAKRRNAEFVLCFVPENKSENARYLYPAIKRFSAVTSATTQCVRIGRVNEMATNPQYSAGVLLKTNLKLGGRNVIPAVETGEGAALMQAMPTVVFGIDVNHAAPGSDKPSYTAVVATMDMYCSDYFTTIGKQDAKKEILENFEQAVFETLTRWEVTNRVAPSRLIIYRDGVAHNQFEKVISVELQQVRQACKRAGGADYMPQIVFICVQMRNRCRIAVEEGHRIVQPRAGTVVDRDIVSRDGFDFYMVPHHGLKGTSRPSHYNVLHNDANLTSDELQRFTFDLCHLYARATKIVSRPAPVYYAHLAAFQAAYYSSDYRGVSDNWESASVSSGGGGSVASDDFKGVVDSMRSKLYYV